MELFKPGDTITDVKMRWVDHDTAPLAKYLY